MRRFAFLATAFAIGGLMLLSASEANGANTVLVHSSGPAAAAFWEFPGPDGSFTGVFVFAGEDRFGQKGKLQTSRTIGVEIFQFSPGADPEDPSDDSLRTIHGGRELANGELVFSGRELDWATLQASIEGEDCTAVGPPGPEPPVFDCTPATIDVDLAWTAQGPLGRHVGSFHDQFDGCISNQHFSFFGRPASTEGSVTAGGTDYTRGETGGGDLIARSSDLFVGIGDCFFPEPPAGP